MPQLPESAREIEGARLVIHSVKHHGEAPDVFGCDQGLVERVVQDSFAVAPALVTPIYSELSEQDYGGILVARKPFPGQDGARDGVHQQRIEPDDFTAARLLYEDER